MYGDSLSGKSSMGRLKAANIPIIASPTNIITTVTGLVIEILERVKIHDPIRHY